MDEVRSKAMQPRSLGLAALTIVACLAPAHLEAATPHAGLPTPPPTLDRSTPRRTMQLFLSAERAGDHLQAAYALDLRDVPPGARREQGPELARKLKAVLDNQLWVDLGALSDAPEGNPDDGRRLDVVGVISRGLTRPVPIEVVQVPTDAGLVWLVSRRTLAELPELYERFGPGWVEERVPAWFPSVRIGEIWLWQWLGLVVAGALGILAGFVVAGMLLGVGRRVAAHTRTEWDDRILALVRSPARLFFAAVVSWLLVQPLRLAAPAQVAVRRVLVIVVLYAGAWFATRLVGLGASFLEERALRMAENGSSDELRVRSLRTQVLVMRRVASILIGVLAVSLMLMQFEVVRSVGMSLLASAGIAGIVIGLAAQKSIATLLAGIQLSITQPVRIGDTVIVEGESGTIEEINLTYVVVKVWDERRLVVPITRFLDAPFQNLTKVAPQLLGTVYFHADYTLKVADAREAFEAILAEHPKWDGRSRGFVVTDAKDRTIELRALVSAQNAGDLWTLRCDVRERLIAWLRDHEEGRYLPRVRVESDGRAPR